VRGDSAGPHVGAKAGRQVGRPVRITLRQRAPSGPDMQNSLTTRVIQVTSPQAPLRSVFHVIEPPPGSRYTAAVDAKLSAGLSRTFQYSFSRTRKGVDGARGDGDDTPHAPEGR